MAITGDFVNGLHLMVGTSLDNKPTTTSENSFFLEEDSGKVYYFSAGSWSEAGAGVANIIASILGGGMGKLTVSFSVNGQGVVEADKSIEEINNAYNAGMYVEGVFPATGQICALCDLNDNTALFQMIVTSPSLALYIAGVQTNGCFVDAIPIPTE